MTDLQNILTNPLTQRAGWALLHFLWQGVAVAALLAAAMLLLRRRSSNLRYVVACVALLAMVATPVATFFLARPDIPLAASHHANPTSEAEPTSGECYIIGDVERPGVYRPGKTIADALAMVGGNRHGSESWKGHLIRRTPDQKEQIYSLDLEALAKERMLGARLQAGDTLVVGAEAPDQPAFFVGWPHPKRTAAPSLESIESAKSWRERAGEIVNPLLPWVVCGWFIGVLILSGWHVRGWMQVRRLRLVGTCPVGREISEALARLCNRLGIGRAVRVVESALVCVPTVVGCLKPIILLPASALTGLTGEQIEAILAHELAHIRRHDYLVNLLQTAAETLLFYHPAAWWVSRRIRAERENCCDDLAVAASGQPLVYARALTAVAKLSLPGARLAVAADGGGKFLTRIRRIVGQPTNDAGCRGRWLAGAFTLLAVLAITITLTLSCATDKTPAVWDNDEPATTQKRSAGESLQRDLTDDFEDGSIDTDVWVVGGAKRGWRKRSRTGVGGWTYSCKEVQGEDGYLRLRVFGPRSGNTYGAEAWARTKQNFNDGRTWLIDFCWQADVAIKGHYDYYHIQITDGNIPETGDVHWPFDGIPGTVDFLTSSDSRGKPRNGKPLMRGTPKRHWSIRIDPKGTAVLYDGPSGTGKVVSGGKLDSKKPWHIRFMVLDATSAGFSAGDTRLNLFSFKALTPTRGPSAAVRPLRPLKLDDSAKGKTFSAFVGQKIRVTLKVDSPLGYYGAVPKVKGDVLELDEMVERAHGRSEAWRTFTLRAKKPGTSKVMLEYKPVPEKKHLPVITKDFCRIVVKPRPVTTRPVKKPSSS